MGGCGITDACMTCVCVQELPAQVGNARATGTLSGKPLLFPQLSYMETHPTHSAVRAVARQWCMATMFAMWYGHITPGRPFAHICQLSHPDLLPQQCPTRHCRMEGCQGNAILRSADGEQYTLHIPHFKTSTK